MAPRVHTSKFTLFLAVLQLHLALVWGFFAGNNLAHSSSRETCPFLATKSFLTRRISMVAKTVLDVPSSSCIIREPSASGVKISSPRQRLRAAASRHVTNRKAFSLRACDDDDGGGTQEAVKQCSSYADSLDIVVLGLSHHTAAVEMREKLSVPEADWNREAQVLCGYSSIAEAAVLSTCNRFEIYLSGKNKYECIRDGMNYLESRVGSDISGKSIRQSIFVLSGDDAVWHLLRVAAGLDSIVLGEGQILGQVKKAYEHGIEEHGRSGKVITRMLNTAITAGKRVRTETGIAKGAVSISSAAAEFTSGILKGEIDDLVLPTSSSPAPQAIYQTPSLDSARISVIGAGKMARLLLIHLESHGVKEVTVVNRSPERLQELRAEFPSLHIEMRGMEDIYSVITESDIVYPSTASPTYLIEPMLLADCIGKRTRPYKVQFIDISVPRNVHPECAAVPGVALYNVDHLKLVVDRNSAKRQQEIVLAEKILLEELEKYQQWQQSLSAIPTITKLHEKAESLRQEELQKLSKKLVSFSERDKDVIDRLSKGLVAKLLHGPINHLRQQKEIESVRTAISQLQQAFNLPNSRQ
jgi:glutamyl-tRNA reductase